MIDRDELDRWLREHDYTLITREQARIFDGPGVVPWDEHRRALAKADAELAALRAAVQTIRGEVDHADRQGYWSMDVGPVRDALGAVSASGSERELDAARARVAEVEADLDKVEGFRADLAERCFRKDLELDELRGQLRRSGRPVPHPDHRGE